METTYKPKALTPDELQALSQEVRQALTELYGDRLDRVILFGSYARGDFRPESDVDYMVVLYDKEVKAGNEIWFFGERASDLTDKFGVFVSFKPVSLTKYMSSDLLFYQNVRREGKTL
ncbi:nucleotidyltransferase domain-containing protein [Spirosoma endbachense]|uniref:Nucleotidyltransferase domain-containing protein n=1 Tax=Spirosoma endbachense TaxID=2666025 RepID=A0A6P1VW85_9BACT|nr:nucleotidyltransferase domain-containing protein [Spirosoma endbachense]QHV97025.1 nucleotidyltransferase domain-containing protein [Spirosoma endbachense]